MNNLKFHNGPQAFEKMMNELFSNPRSKSHCRTDYATKEHTRSFTPATDILESETDFVLRVMLPGLSKEDISIDLNDGKLTVSAERTFEKEEGIKYHKVQTRFGKFSRTFVLPENVDPENIGAKYDAGILTLTLPKKPEAPGRTIEVK